MGLTYLEHFLVQTTDFDATCDWYERVLGMEPALAGSLILPLTPVTPPPFAVGLITIG